MDKRQLTKTLVGVVITSASVFSLYKLYKTVKKVRLELAAEQAVADIPIETKVRVKEDLEELVEDDLDHFEDEEERYIRAEINHVAMDPEHNPAFIFEDDLSDGGFIHPETEGAVTLLDGATMHPSMVDYEEEMKELRFPPNSNEALNQYINMKLAEFQKDSELEKILIRLFAIPFRPTNPSDKATWDLLVEERREFFGPSSHNNHVTIAELILYYANYLDFDLSGGIASWTAQLVYNLELSSGIGSATLDSLVDSLTRHILTNDNGYGMFALNDDEYHDMLNDGSNRATTYVTFMMQYNAYLKKCME